jgi:hypothetical protein
VSPQSVLISVLSGKVSLLRSVGQAYILGGQYLSSFVWKKVSGFCTACLEKLQYLRKKLLGSFSCIIYHHLSCSINMVWHIVFILHSLSGW